MKKIILIVLLVLFAAGGFAQVDPPAGYTTNWGFRMWNEGDYPGGDSVNQNWIDLDSYLKIRDQRIDSILNLAKTFAGIKTFSSAIKTDTIRVNTKPYLTMPTGLNFLIQNDIGSLLFLKNYSTTILEWDENDGQYWQTAYPFSASQLEINGTNINTAGTLSNLPYKNARNTFTTTNIFNYDSVLFPFGYLYLGDGSTYGGAIISKMPNDIGGFGIYKTNLTQPLLEWDENDGQYWQTAYPFSASQLEINGANINTAGTLSNLPYKNARNTFTTTNIFNYDSVLFPFGYLYLGDGSTYGGAIISKMPNDIGGFGIYKTNLTQPLLEWDENDGLYWQTAYPFSASELQIAGTSINTFRTLTNVLYRGDTCDVDFVNTSNGYKVDNTLIVDKRGYFRPISSADGDAPNNSIYYSTTQSALVYKDESGNVHALH